MYQSGKHHYLNRVYLIALVLCIAHLSYGQKDTEIVKHNLIISATPHHLIEFYHGSSANVGFEVRSNNRYSFYGEFGKYLPNSVVTNNYDQSGYTVLGELKRYFASGKTYLSLQYMYGEQSYLRADPIDPGSNFEYDPEFYEVYDVEKTFRDFSIRYGGLFVHNNWLSFNPYFGMGVRFQEVQRDGFTKDEGFGYFEPTVTPHDLFQRFGKTSYFKIHAGIRIGVKIF